MPIRAIDPAKRAGPNPDLSPSDASSQVQSSDVAGLGPPVIPVAAATHADKGRNDSPDKRRHHKVDRTTSNWDENGDFIVGKGRPPRDKQWQKGQSGNPRGPKPREKVDPLAAFENELLSDFTAKVNGNEVTLNLGTFALQLLKTGAAKGTVKSQQLLLDLFLGAVRRRVEREDSPEMRDWEQDVIDQMLEEYGLPPEPVKRATDRGVAAAGEAK